MTNALWNQVRDWWSSAPEPMIEGFFADDGPAVRAYRGYLRVWLSEMALSHDRRRATDRFPAVQASIRLSFGGSPETVFSTVVRPPRGQEAPAIHRDIPLTALLPFAGGTVDLQVSLLDVAGTDDLRLALDILGEFSSLLTPPLATVAAVATRVANGIGRVDDQLGAGGQRPVLSMQRGLAAGPEGLLSGYLLGSLATEGELTVEKGRLRGARSPVDYLVLRVETMAERDDWRFPEWDALIGQATAARVLGQGDRFRQLRDEVLSRIVLSADLTPADRKRVAIVVRDELDTFELGAVGQEKPDTVAGVVEQRGLPSAISVRDLTLTDLLSER